MTYTCPAREYEADALLLKFTAPSEQITRRYWESWQVHTSPRIARDFQNFLPVCLYN
jgi:hypothetical protein